MALYRRMSYSSTNGQQYGNMDKPPIINILTFKSQTHMLRLSRGIFVHPQAMQKHSPPA